MSTRAQVRNEIWKVRDIKILNHFVSTISYHEDAPLTICCTAQELGKMEIENFVWMPLSLFIS